METANARIRRATSDARRNAVRRATRQAESPQQHLERRSVVNSGAAQERWNAARRAARQAETPQQSRERKSARKAGQTMESLERDRLSRAAIERERRQSLSGAGVTNNTDVANGMAEEDWEAPNHFMGDINGEVSDDEYEEHEDNNAADLVNVNYNSDEEEDINAADINVADLVNVNHNNDAVDLNNAADNPFVYY